MSAVLCEKSTRNALRYVMILHSCLALGQTPPTTHQPQPTIHTKLSFCWCNHNWWKQTGSQNLHVLSWLQSHCAWKNHKEALPVSTSSYFSIGNVLLVVGSFTKMHGWFQQLAIWTWVDTQQQHLPPSRRLRIWFSMIWRSSADRPSSSRRYPLLNYFTLRIIEDWFNPYSLWFILFSFLNRTPNISCRTFRKTDRLKLP